MHNPVICSNFFHASIQLPILPPMFMQFSWGILETIRPSKQTNIIAWGEKNFDQASEKETGEKYLLLLALPQPPLLLGPAPVPLLEEEAAGG